MASWEERWALREQWMKLKSSQLSTGDLLGSGKYGSVYALVSCPKIAAKTCAADLKSRGLKQAFREYIISLLQKILLESRCTPNLVMHFGSSPLKANGELSLKFYMERCDGSLDRMAPEVLRKDADWSSAIFQALSACVVLGETYGIVHNDLYARNMLVKWNRKGESSSRRTLYKLFGEDFLLVSDFLLVICDFGMAASRLLDAPLAAPELKYEIPSKGYGGCFKSLGGGDHILKFSVPPYTRDVYTVMRYGAAKGSLGVEPPAKIVGWAEDCLKAVDLRHSEFSAPRGLTRAVHDFFLRLARLHDIEEPTGGSCTGADETWSCDSGRKASLLQLGMEAIRKATPKHWPSSNEGGEADFGALASALGRRREVSTGASKGANGDGRRRSE